MSKRRSGLTLIYSVVILIALTAIASMAIDFGRVQMIKTQLRAAADSAARAAAHDLPYSLATARTNAVYYAKQNKAEGVPVALDSTNDIQFGKWDTKTRKFTQLAAVDQKSMNAVRVVAQRVASRGTAVPLILASVIGQPGCDVHAESIVMVIPLIAVNQNVPATANPFLSGMPKGAVASLNNPHNSPDYAGDANNPKQSPLAVGMPVTMGDELTFDNIDGTARHDPNLPYFDPDGEMSDIGHNTNYDENGIKDIKAPINALVGIYLSDEAPNKSSVPAIDDAACPSDFSTVAARNRTTYAPQLKQIFYIGDGLTSGGVKQKFVAPQGATRLFLATWDFFEWNNNAGYRNIQINRPERIITVK